MMTFHVRRFFVLRTVRRCFALAYWRCGRQFSSGTRSGRPDRRRCIAGKSAARRRTSHSGCRRLSAAQASRHTRHTAPAPETPSFGASAALRAPRALASAAAARAPDRFPCNHAGGISDRSFAHIISEIVQGPQRPDQSSESMRRMSFAQPAINDLGSNAPARLLSQFAIGR